MAHVADRLGQAQGQAARQQEGEQQGEQRQDAGLDHDFLLALAEGVIGHADDHPAQVVIADRGCGGLALLQEVAVQADLLQAYGRLENLYALRAVGAFVGLLDVHKDVVAAVLHLEEAHVRDAESGAHQAFEHLVVARDHPVLRGRGQLVGDQLPGVVQLLAQVLDAHEGEEADQQQGQQQGRAKAYDLRAGVDVPAQAFAHGVGSPSARALAAADGSIGCRPRARATCWLPLTPKRAGYRLRGQRPGGWSSNWSRTASQSSWSL